MLKKILAVIISILLAVSATLFALQKIGFWTFLLGILLAYAYIKFIQPKL